MRTLFTSIVAAVALVALGSAAAPAPDPIQDLRRDLDLILDDPDLRQAQASVLVTEADGTVLYEHNPDLRGMPASNNKLFTAAAALEVLGADHRFDTEVRAAGSIRGRVLHGDLHLVGGGDPTLLEEDYDELAAKVAASGIRSVTGDLVADDTRWDSTRYGRSWGWDSEQFYYGAQISPLTIAPDTDYDAGTVLVTVRPGAAVGDAAEVTVAPETSYVEIDSRATTTDGSTSLSIDRAHGTNTIHVTGAISESATSSSVWRAVWEPTGLAADVFIRALARHGVRGVSDVRHGGTPDDAQTIASHESMTLAELLIPFMKLSNNGHAEALIKEIGYQTSGNGTWSAGIAAAEDVMDELGVASDQLRFVDGSGLSRMNIISAQQITNLLVAAPEQPWFGDWYDSLPVAGVEERLVGGTLRFRMVGTAAEGNVRAKTGSLTGATALSGYVTDADGEQLIFSIVTNNHIAVDPKPLVEDPVAIRLAEFSRSGAAVAGGDSGDRGAERGTADPGSTGDVQELECSWVRAC